MAKTYILEPTEVQLTFSEEILQGFLAAEITNNLENSFLEVEGYSFKVKYAGQLNEDQHIFTEDGTIPESAPSVYATILDTSINIASPNLPAEDCTLTISIYTGGVPGLEDKNVVYEYQIEANNSIKDILLAVMEQNGDNAVNIPGYSVMELLVENLLVFHGITVGRLATFRATSFANDVEKIAWIIRNIEHDS